MDDTNVTSDGLTDPNTVHVNMLAGRIAKPSPAQIWHIYGAELLAAMPTADAAGIVERDERLFNDLLGNMASYGEWGSPSYREAALRTIAEYRAEAATTIAAQAAENERLREALAPKPKGTGCPQSPTGFHVVDTSMESGDNNCFYCEADMRGYVRGVVVRPTQPMADDSLWYRGWEAGHDDMAARYVKEYWIAYKGGCDLDARAIAASSWDALLDEIDAEMEGLNDGE